MAVEVGSAFVSIVPSLRGFSSATQRELSRSGLDRQAGIAGNRAGDHFSGGFASRARVGINRSGIFTGIATTARGLAPLLGVAAGAVAVFGLKTASSMEQAQIAFTTMLGSAKDAKAFLKDLSAFAKRTPFDLPSVRTGAQKLLAYGFAAKDVLPTLTAIGDASAGLNLGAEGIDRLTTSIGQIQAKGRVQSDELLQLTEAGVPALKILANQFGTTTADMQTMVTKGLVPAEQAIPALLGGLEQGTKGAAGETAKFAGLMAKQSKSLGGIFSNLIDTVTQGLGKAFKPVAKQLEGVLPSLIGKIGDGFRSLRSFIADALPVVSSFGHVFADRIWPVLQAVAGVVLRLARGLLPALTGAWHSITGALNDSHSGLSRIGDLFSWLADNVLPVVIRVFGFWIRNVGRGLGFAIRVVGFLGDAFAKVKDFLTGPFVRGAGAAVSQLVRGFKFLLDVWFTVVGGIIHGAAAAFGWVPKVGDKLSAASAAFDQFRADVDTQLSAIATDAGQIGSAAGNNFAGGFFAAVGKAFNAIRGIFDPSARFDFGVGGDWASKGKTTGKQNTTPTITLPDLTLPDIDAAAKDVDKGAEKIGKSFSQLVDNILGPLRDLLGKAKDLAHSIADGITGSLGLGSLATSTDSLGAQFTNSLKGILSGLAGQRQLVRKFGHQLKRLATAGYSPAVIQTVAAMGAVEGSAFASTLLQASHKQVGRINRRTRGISRGAAAIGSGVAGEVYGPRIAAEVRRTRQAIDKASKNTELGHKTVDRLEHAFTRAQRKSKVILDTGKLDWKYGREVLAS